MLLYIVHKSMYNLYIIQFRCIVDLPGDVEVYTRRLDNNAVLMDYQHQ